MANITLRKIIVPIIILLTLVVVTYNFISAHYQIDALKKQLDEHNTSAKSRITLYENEDKIFYHLLSDDGKLWIAFTYDEQGLKDGFLVQDGLSGKEFGFNFYNFMIDGNGELTNFFYKDSQYYIATNVIITEFDQKLIEREEWIGGFETIYTLFPDGTTAINTENKGYTPKLKTWE
jgi:hypothetical protein